jgi:hypothetical protein
MAACPFVDLDERAMAVGAAFVCHACQGVAPLSFVVRAKALVPEWDARVAA